MASPLDLPRLSRGRAGSVSPATESTLASSAGRLFLLLCSTGRSGSSDDALLAPDPLAPAVPAPEVLVPEVLVPDELVPAPLFEVSLPESFLCSTGRSGSLGCCAWPPESVPLPEPLPDPPEGAAGCLRCRTGSPLCASSSSNRVF